MFGTGLGLSVGRFVGSTDTLIVPPRAPSTMERPSRRRFLAGCATASIGLAGCAIPGTLETTRSSDDVSIPAGTPLVVENRNGDVVVDDGGGDTATLEVEKSTRYGADLFDQIRVETGERDGRFRIETVDDTPPGRSVTVDLTIYLPDDAPVEAVETVNGDITLQDVAGDATIRTTNGDVLATAVDGFLTLRSGNGDVETRGVRGLDAARTTNGDVDVEVPAIRGDTAVRTVNGDVRVAVPETLDAVIDFRTTNGDVGYSGLDLDLSVDRATHLRGTLGAGGSELAAESTNGDVRLRPL